MVIYAFTEGLELGIDIESLDDAQFDGGVANCFFSAQDLFSVCFPGCGRGIRSARTIENWCVPWSPW